MLRQITPWCSAQKILTSSVMSQNFDRTRGGYFRKARNRFICRDVFSPISVIAKPRKKITASSPAKGSMFKSKFCQRPDNHDDWFARLRLLGKQDFRRLWRAEAGHMDSLIEKKCARATCEIRLGHYAESGNRRRCSGKALAFPRNSARTLRGPSNRCPAAYWPQSAARSGLGPKKNAGAGSLSDSSVRLGL